MNIVLGSLTVRDGEIHCGPPGVSGHSRESLRRVRRQKYIKISTGIPRLINRVVKSPAVCLPQQKRLVDEDMVRFVRTMKGLWEVWKSKQRYHSVSGAACLETAGDGKVCGVSGRGKTTCFRAYSLLQGSRMNAVIENI